MINPRLLVMISLCFLCCANAFAADCTQFMSDYKENKLTKNSGYTIEAKKPLYWPGEYCAFSPLNLVSHEKNRVEAYVVEQCRETRYKVVKTTLLCAEDSAKARIKTTCEVDGMMLSPCFKDKVVQGLQGQLSPVETPAPKKRKMKWKLWRR